MQLSETLADRAPASQMGIMKMGNGNGRPGREHGTGRPNDGMRLFFLGLGIVLMLLAPVVGALPGPGGIIVLAAGLALTLKNSNWAKRLYVRFKQRYPRYGRFADWSLRRRSHFRRLNRPAGKERARKGDD